MEFLGHGVNIKLLKDNSYEFLGVTSNAKDIHYMHSWDPSALRESWKKIVKEIP